MNIPSELLKSLRVRTWLAYGTIFLLMATSVVIVLRVKGRSPELQADQVLNKTSAVEVISVTPGQNNSIVVVVKNILSDKNITGLVFRHENVNIEIDFISGFGDYTIPSGKTYSQVITPQVKATLETSDVSILSAVLDDHSINGDMKMGQQLLDRRRGKKEQLQLILPIIKDGIDSKAVDMVARVVAGIDKVPHPHDVEIHPQIKAGAHSIRELVLSKIQDHVNSDVSTYEANTQAMSRIYDEYSRLLSKL